MSLRTEDCVPVVVPLEDTDEDGVCVVLREGDGVDDNVPFALTVVDGEVVEDVDKLFVAETDAERERRVEFVDVCVGDVVTVFDGVVPFTRLPVEDTVLDAEGAADGVRIDDVVPGAGMLLTPEDFVVVWLNERVEVCEAVFV